MNRFQIIALFIVVAACGLSSCRKPEQKETAPERAIKTDSSPVAQPTPQASTSTSEAVQDIAINALISGEVSEIRVHEGDRVLQGATVAVIGLSEANKKIEQAEKELRDSELYVGTTRTNYLAARQRVESKQLNKAVLDRFQSQMHEAAKRRNAALNQMFQVSQWREACYLRAPRNGEVVSIAAPSNRVVTAGQPIIIIR